jgi:hypothetical protein
MPSREHDFNMCEECQVQPHRENDRYCSVECEEVAMRCKFSLEAQRSMDPQFKDFYYEHEKKGLS